MAYIDPMPDARCPMPDARCPMPDAQLIVFVKVSLGVPAETELESFGEDVELRVRSGDMEKVFGIVARHWRGKVVNYGGE